MCSPVSSYTALQSIILCEFVSEREEDMETEAYLRKFSYKNIKRTFLNWIILSQATTKCPVKDCSLRSQIHMCQCAAAALLRAWEPYFTSATAAKEKILLMFVIWHWSPYSVASAAALILPTRSQFFAAVDIMWHSCDIFPWMNATGPYMKKQCLACIMCSRRWEKPQLLQGHGRHYPINSW